MCNNSPAEANSSENGWSSSQWTIPHNPPSVWRGSPERSRASLCRKGMRDRRSGQVRPWLEHLLAQILVVVASTPLGEEQRKPCCVRLRAGVEQVSPSTAVECGLTDREPSGKFTEQPKLRRVGPQSKPAPLPVLATPRVPPSGVRCGADGRAEPLAGVANRQASARFCCDGAGALSGGNTPGDVTLSKPRGSGTPEEFSFPPDGRLMWAIDWHATWWHKSSAQQGSAVSALVVSAKNAERKADLPPGGHSASVWIN